MRRALGLGLVALCALPAGAPGQAREGLILFKDGFSQQGKIVELRELIIDPATGVSVSVRAGGLAMFLDDGVRRIFFPHLQLDRVVERKEGKEKLDRVVFVRAGTKQLDRRSIGPRWQMGDYTEWDSTWKRFINFKTETGELTMEQRLVAMTSHQIQIQTMVYRWDISYLTREWSPDAVRTMLGGYMKEQKVYKGRSAFEKGLDVARFLHEVGWHEEADKEFDALERTYFDQKEKIAPYREAVKKALANLVVVEIDRAHRVGQHQRVRDGLAYYAKEELAAQVSDHNKLLAQEIKSKYDALGEKLAETRKSLLVVPHHVGDKVFWKAAFEEILGGLNEDTLPRLEKFSTYARQYRRDLDEKRKPSQTADEVFALAVTGWLQGDSAAETDVKLARQLWKTRDLVRDYMKAADPAARERILAGVSRADEVHIDQLARLIQMLPPPDAPEETDTKVHKREISLPDSEGGEYLVQLPPGYHPFRPYPLLILLHGGREKAEVMIERFSDLAARHGYIVAAPIWAKPKAVYNHTAREQAYALDTLRDVRRAYNVDSDRVFLFGWEAGADMAFDVGLSHPDQFAGVVPMNGNPSKFATAYWTNGQYLPFYVIEGERNSGNPAATRTLFKNWIGSHYPSIYVEYRGRASEWYGVELETAFDWMSRKKRYHPLRGMGSYHAGGGAGEEFKTMRKSDNKFYWLRAGAIKGTHLNDGAGWSKTTQPATMQASISLGNELELKAKEKGGTEVTGAKTWTSIHVRTKGVGDLTLWITPSMHDFSRPLQIKWNGTSLGLPRPISPSIATLLEDQFYTGDRQRIHYAKVDLP